MLRTCADSSLFHSHPDYWERGSQTAPYPDKVEVLNRLLLASRYEGDYAPLEVPFIPRMSARYSSPAVLLDPERYRYLRIDTLEQAFIKSASGRLDIGPAGYLAAYAVADENLRLGATVIADSVNALHVTRNAWRNVALHAGVAVLKIELICSDSAMHRQRVEGRCGDISGHELPTWKSVLERQYEPWESAHLVIDTAKVSVAQAVETITHCLPNSSLKARKVQAHNGHEN